MPVRSTDEEPERDLLEDDAAARRAGRRSAMEDVIREDPYAGTFEQASDELAAAIEDFANALLRGIVTSWWWRLVAPLIGRHAPKRSRR